MGDFDYDLVIVGMGSGGMVAAEFASTLDIRVAAVERSRVGGDCLWTGCVPSKSLLASSKAAHTIRHADRYGLTATDPAVDTARVWDRIRDIQQRLAQTTDSPERFERLGIDMHVGRAGIAGPHEVTVDGATLRTRFVLLATGSRPTAPPIPGLAEAGYLTSETLFEQSRAPQSIVLIGGGPIAIELSQAFTRLGVQTTTLERADRVLVRDDPELVDRLVAVLRTEGVDLRVGVEVERVTVENGRKVVHTGKHRFAADELFVGAGRQANVEGLGLEEAGVRLGPSGVAVDTRMRTSVGSIYACGDVAGRYQFTHSAGYEATRAIRNMFFPASARDDYEVPWCTFTDPELARVGLTETQARERWGDDVRVWQHELDDSDRARAEGADAGAMRVVTHKGRIVGGHVLSPAAGEIIHELVLAVDRGLSLTDLAGIVHVYPTFAIGLQQLAGEAAYESARRLGWLVRSRAGPRRTAA